MPMTVRQGVAAAGLAFAVSVAWGGQASAAPYAFTTIDVPAALGVGTTVNGISNTGQLVGAYATASFNSPPGPAFELGFTYAAGQFTSFNAGNPGALYTTGEGINSLGQVTAQISNGTAITVSVIGAPGAFGSYSLSAPAPAGAPFGGVDLLHGINDLGQAAGYYTNDQGGFTGYVVDAASKQGVALAVPGVDFLQARDVNTAGAVAGYYAAKFNSPSTQGFVLTGTTFTPIDVPGAADTFVNGINAAGVLAGSYLLNGQTNGFVDDNGVFTTIDVQGASYTDVEGINDLGQVAGTFRDATGSHGFVATPVTAVPEPASVTLFGAGVAAMGLALARRRRHAP